MLVDSARSSVAPGSTPSAPSFEAVYAEFFPFVWRSARRLGVPPSALDDVVQEIFIVAHRRLPDFEGRSSVRTWLFGIALRVVRQHRRTMRRKDRATEEHDWEALPSTHPTPHDAAERAEELSLLHRLLDALDDDKREVFVLAELEQMPVPEIAIAVGINVNTAYSRLRLARGEFDRGLARHRIQTERANTRPDQICKLGEGR